MAGVMARHTGGHAIIPLSCEGRLTRSIWHGSWKKNPNVVSAAGMSAVLPKRNGVGSSPIACAVMSARPCSIMKIIGKPEVAMVMPPHSGMASIRSMEKKSVSTSGVDLRPRNAVGGGSLRCGGGGPK